MTLFDNVFYLQPINGAKQQQPQQPQYRVILDGWTTPPSFVSMSIPFHDFRIFRIRSPPFLSAPYRAQRYIILSVMFEPVKSIQGFLIGKQRQSLPRYTDLVTIP